MAFPGTLLLTASALGKVDDDNYRALVIDKAQLPYPENQNGSKRLIVESMASVGINVDATDVVYAPAPGDTRSGFVAIRLVAQVTESAQLNSKKVWASHPLGRTEAVALPDIAWLKRLPTIHTPSLRRCQSSAHATSRFGRFGWPFRHPGCTQGALPA